MTTAEMIAVMQAFDDGKKIEYFDKVEKKWVSVNSPCWNWHQFEYRVKPEAKYRPYESCDEMVEDFKQRFKVNCPDYAMPLIWLKNKDGRAYLVEEFFLGGKSVKISRTSIGLGDLYKYYTYLDGSPIGKLVVE